MSQVQIFLMPLSVLSQFLGFSHSLIQLDPRNWSVGFVSWISQTLAQIGVTFCIKSVFDSIGSPQVDSEICLLDWLFFRPDAGFF
jgi:predicted ferric reductase